MANFEENANQQATSNIETAEEIDITQQVMLLTAGDTVVGLKMNDGVTSNVKKENENGVHLLDHQKFDGNHVCLRELTVYACKTSQPQLVMFLLVSLSKKFPFLFQAVSECLSLTEKTATVYHTCETLGTHTFTC